MPVSSLLLALALLYGIGVVRVQWRTRTRRILLLQSLAMISGLLAIYIALVSPLDDLAETLLSMHMVQHLLLMLIAAPLLIAAHPMRSLIWSLPRQARRICGRWWNEIRGSRVCRAIIAPACSWTLFCATLLLWHVPAIFRWVLGGEVRHALMHLSFLGAGLLFWRTVLSRGPRQLNYLAGALFVFSAALVTGLPGALIAFAKPVMYLQQPFPTLPWGMTPLADQQLAGLIMWIPMDLILFTVALTLLGLSMSGRKPNRSHCRRGAQTVRFASTRRDDRPHGLLYDSERK